MESVFRGADMSLCQLYIPTESAYEVTSQLGELGIVQFVDLNEETSAFNKHFVNDVKRCFELERQLIYFEKEINNSTVKKTETRNFPAPSNRELIDFEATFNKIETELKDVNNNIEALNRNYSKLSELKTVLKQANYMFLESDTVQFDSTGPLQPDIEIPEISQNKLGIITGTLPRDRLPAFSRLLWLASRGNIFIRHIDLQSDLQQSDNDQLKSLFTVFCQGERLETMVKKICEGYQANIYPCPEDTSERMLMIDSITTRIVEMLLVINKSNEQRDRILQSIGDNFNSWRVKIHKVKAIYHTMNMFRVERNYVAHCWVPSHKIINLKNVLEDANEKIHSNLPSIINQLVPNCPPTYIPTNKFTQTYQNVIDAYGVGTYKEMNPMPFTLITFPFLFAVMFGDTGHGFIMALFAGIIIWYEKRLKSYGKDNEIWQIFFSGRYLIFLMGIFSMYTGLIYNDIFSKSLNIFGSSWHANYDNMTIFNKDLNKLDPNSSAYDGYPYPFGVDPVWQMAKNKIDFSNSLKKKMSVIIGVLHMTFGLVLSFFNYRHNKSLMNILCVFIPELIFMLSIFGYLILIIFVKWIKFGSDDTNCAPSLLIGLINMFMFKYQQVDETECSLLPWYNGQVGLQSFLVILAIICIPWMLFSKPFILYRSNKSKSFLNAPIRLFQNRNSTDRKRLVDDDDVDLIHGSKESIGSDVAPLDVAVDLSNSQNPEPEFTLGDILMTQAIHTIEYCLGCVSNTASYLRLWALSLAHAQLSEVLWHMVLRLSFMINSYLGAILLFLTFAAWAIFTLVILILMEGLSAFLHALRLHWIEFQTKFYKGNGWIFEPFSYKHIIDDD